MENISKVSASTIGCLSTPGCGQETEAKNLTRFQSKGKEQDLEKRKETKDSNKNGVFRHYAVSQKQVRKSKKLRKEVHPQEITGHPIIASPVAEPVLSSLPSKRDKSFCYF